MSAAAAAMPSGWEVSTSAALKWAYSQFNADSHAGGSNNSPRMSGLLAVLDGMHLSADSVFLDLGSGFGMPSFAAALTYGCKCIGVEYQPHLVQRSNDLCARLKLTDRCQFIETDIMKLDEKWLAEQKVTHIYSFDTVFAVNVWQHMNKFIEAYGDSLRALASNFAYSYWMIDGLSGVTQQQISMCVSGERRTFHIMTPEKRSPKRKAGSDSESDEKKTPSLSEIESDDPTRPKRLCNPFYYTELWAKRVSFKTGLPLRSVAKDLGLKQMDRLKGAKSLIAGFSGAKVVCDSDIGVELHHNKMYWSFDCMKIPEAFVGQTLVGAVFDDSDGWIRVGVQFTRGILWNEDADVYDPFVDVGQSEQIIDD